MNAYLSHTRGAQQLRTLLLRLPLGLANAVAGVAYLAVAASSLVPKALRPTTGIVPGFAEHFAAYFVLGAVAVLAWKTRTPLWRLAVIHASLAAVLEVAQTAVPGRVPALADFAASALGSAVGIALMAYCLNGGLRPGSRTASPA